MTQIGSFPTAHGDFPARLSFQPEIDNPRSCLCKNPRQQGTAYLSQYHAVFTDIAAGGKEHLGLESCFAKESLLQLEHGGPAGDQDKRILQKTGQTDLGRILSLYTSQTGQRMGGGNSKKNFFLCHGKIGIVVLLGFHQCDKTKIQLIACDEILHGPDVALHRLNPDIRELPVEFRVDGSEHIDAALRNKSQADTPVPAFF